jgi:hypothetical protein
LALVEFQQPQRIQNHLSGKGKDVEDDTPIEPPDVPESMPQMDGGTVSTQASKRPFFDGYKSGGKVNLNTCKVRTHEKNKSSPNW